MTRDGHAACGSRHSFGIALACAAWLSLAPPVRAEDAAAPDDGPGPVSLIGPVDGAAVPGGKGGAGGSGAGNVMVAFSWHPSRSAPVWYFVEVLALGQDESREVFTGYTRQTGLRLRLDAGQYVWRVLAVSRASARYGVSPWQSFTANGAPPEGGR